MKIAKDISPVSAATAPWLVFPTGNHRNQLTFFNLSEDPNNSNCVRKVCHEIRQKMCLASMHGWFIVKQVTSTKQFQCSLWNPTTREIVNLPSIKSKDFQDISIEQNCILLSSPSEPINPDCMVLFWGDSFFLFWKQGDKNWTIKTYKNLKNGIEPDEWVKKVILCPKNGYLYAPTSHNRVAIIDRKTCDVLSVLDFERPQFFPDILRCCEYVVESCGEIYCVGVHFVGLSEEKINHIEILKMDPLKEVWVKVECLGDRIFCLSYTNCVSFSASKAGMEGNKVYLTLWEDDHLYVFDVQDECLSVHLPCQNLATAWTLPFWMMPTNSNSLIEINNENESKTTEEKLIKMETLDITDVVRNDNVEFKVQSSTLPRDVLLSITARLSLPVDYMNFRLVCKTFALLVPASGQWTRAPYPSLMFSNREKTKCSFLDPMHNNYSYCFIMPELLDARICFSKDGWLLMKKGARSMFFFNPFTKAIIRLPDLPEYSRFNSFSFTAPPTSTSCIVFCFFSSYTYVSISSLHLGDKAWNNKEFTNDTEIVFTNNNPVFYEGAFYCLGLEGHLGVFDLSEREWTVLKIPCPDSSIHQSYLIECNGEMLAVFVGEKGKWVHVYELDRTTMNWRLLNSLEDQVLFVSRTTSLALKAVNKLLRNKIWFPFSFNNKNKNNCVFYCLETCTWQSSFGDFIREDFCDTKEFLHCTWIQPWVNHSMICMNNQIS